MGVHKIGYTFWIRRTKVMNRIDARGVPRNRVVNHEKEEEESRPTRKDLIDIRRKLFNLPTPSKQRRRRSEERRPKKKPGRKPETLQGKGLKTHDFECSYLPSDVESDYEGYLSESEDITGQVPKLKRSQSSDSIFLDMNYKDFRFNRLSYLHKCCIHRPKHSTVKLKRRKMNRIVQKHALRFLTLQRSHLAFKEMLECYHGNLPRLADEVARTKNCIRNPHKHKKLNVPRVFTYGDADLVDVCSQLLKDTVAHAVAFEHASTDACNTMTREIQEFRVKRRRKIETLPKNPRKPLPSFDYLAMEFFFLKHVNRHVMGDCILSLHNFTQRCSNFALAQPKYQLMYHMRMQFVQREEYEFEEFLKTQRKRKRHLDRSLKQVLIENRSYQAEVMKDHERRLARREHAERVQARAKLPPEEQARLDEEDRKNKEENEKEKARLKVIQKETKILQKKLIITRLKQEADAEKMQEAEEAKLRKRHRKRIKIMQVEAGLERHELLSEYQELEAVRQERSNKYQKERKRAERRRREREAEERRIREEEEEAERRRWEETVERRRTAEEYKKKKLEKVRALEEQERMAEKKRLEALREKENLREAQEALINVMVKQRQNKIEKERRLKELREEGRRNKHEDCQERRNEELEEKRQQIQKAIKTQRALRLVAEFAKEVVRHIERNKQITLAMCYKDKEGVYNTARDAFKNLNCVEMIEKAVPQFVAALKVMGKWDEVCEYFINFSNPATIRLCVIPPGFKQFAKNIVSGFIYKSLEKKWFFMGNMETMFHNIEPDVKAAFVEKITEVCEPLVLNQSVDSSVSPSVLQDSLIHDVFQRSSESTTPLSVASHRKSVDSRKIQEYSDEDNLAGIVFSKPLQLPQPSFSHFWELIELWVHHNNDVIRKESLEDQILADVRSHSTKPDKAIWVFPVLGVCYTLVFPNRKTRETTNLLRGGLKNSPDSLKCLEEIIGQLLLIGSYFEVAARPSENLAVVIKHNGFYPAARHLPNLIRLIFQLLNCFNLSGLMKPDIPFDDALSFVFEVIKDYSEDKLIEQYGAEINEFSKTVDEVIHFIHAFNDTSQEPDKQHIIMVKWASAIQEHYGEKIQEITQKAFMNAKHSYQNHCVEQEEDDVRSNESMIRSASFGFDANSDMEVIEAGQNENINTLNYSVFSSEISRKRGRQERCEPNNKRPRICSPEDTDFQTRLPDYDEPFIQQVFRTIEESFHNLSMSNQEVLKTHLYGKFDKNHLKESLYRFHIMVKKSDEEYMESSSRHDKYNWSQYERQRIDNNEEHARTAEDLYLSLFEHIVISQKDFVRLKWDVPRKRGYPIEPIDFFTNLKWHVDRDWFNRNTIDNSLVFSFRVYHHIWFMGALAPPSYSVYSHETMPDGWCGGCTNGDVIIIKDCTCENHKDAENGNFCYTRTKVPVPEATHLTADRLLGRFVCEHGPSSCLVLDYSAPYDPNTETDQLYRDWEPFASRYTNFKTSLKIESSTEGDIFRILSKHPNEHKIGIEEDDFFIRHAHRLVPRKSRQVARPGGSKRRTKSEEAPIRPKDGDVRFATLSLSCIDLTELNSYVSKKWNYARRAISPKRKSVQSKNNIPPSLDEKEVSSLETLLSRKNHSSDSERFDLIAAMFECGYHVDKKDEHDREESFRSIIDSHQQYGLLHVFGEPIKPNGRSIPMAPIPMVAELHKEFRVYREAWINDVMSSIMKLREILNEEKYEPFKKLTKCYVEIFRFNGHLFRMYLDTVGFQIFNSYAVYDAEKNRNVTFLRKGIEELKESVEGVLNAFFNERPLIRQLEDLCQIKDDHTSEDLDSHMASLCRYAINRIRVPGFADQKLNLTSWANSTRDHENSLEVAHLDIQSTFPPDFNEDDYLKKIGERGFRPDVFKQIMNSFYFEGIGVSHTVFLALGFQFYDFFETLRIEMPNANVDPLMRVFYGHQSFLNVFNVLYKQTHYLTATSARKVGDVLTSVLITGIVQIAKQHRHLTLKSNLDDMMMELSNYKALPLPIYPSTIGVSFACFKKQLIISVVEESKILTRDECVQKRYLKFPEHQEMATLDDGERQFHVIVDKRNRELSMCFPVNKDSYKDDHFVVKRKLHKSFLFPQTNWNMILRCYINGKINKYDHYLNIQPLPTGRVSTSRIGGLERRIEKKKDVKRFVNQFKVTIE
ncbi:unnamed protein product [Caenorhabditis brenneri]